jgi:hypothetical protein
MVIPFYTNILMYIITFNNSFTCFHQIKNSLKLFQQFLYGKKGKRFEKTGIILITLNAREVLVSFAHCLLPFDH